MVGAVALILPNVIGAQWIAPVQAERARHRPTLVLERHGVIVGQGLRAAMPAGLRALAADFLWLRANLSWERRDLDATKENLHLVIAMDPRPLVFWINGARMLAYDLPGWRVAALAGRGPVPDGVRRRIGEDQAQRALAWLDEARRFHPDSPAVFIESANISFNCLHDPIAAAAAYRRAALQPEAPRYAARLHAEMLRRAGRKAEALAWLVALHPGLPRDEEAAAADLVLARIRDLETELGLSPEQRYREPVL